MIASLTGKITAKSPISKKDNHFVIDVSGVGYLVFTTAQTAKKLDIDDELTIHTYLAVREDALDLYGFINQTEVDIFKLLISISGIGPKTALQILNQTNIEDIRQAVILDKPELLVATAGLGKKTAEKIVLGLSDKIKEILKGAEGTTLSDDSEVIEALVTLGFSSQQVRTALQQVPAEITNSEEKIKAVLKVLGGRK